MSGIQPPRNMQHYHHSITLSSLLSMLRDKHGFSVINANTLTCRLLLRNDYATAVEQLLQVSESDVKNLLDFILYLLPNRRQENLDTTSMEINKRARHFMLKIFEKTRVRPPSLTATGVNVQNWQEIGRGGYGSVSKGEYRGVVVALKLLFKPGDSPYYREALMWRSLKHKFVLPFLGIHESGNEKASWLLLVSPYMNNGTLIRWRKEEMPSIIEIQKRILEVAQGMEYIHSEGVVHGDLRGDNVLLDDDLHVKIADFGLTRVSGATNSGTGARHNHFAAPELFGDATSDNIAARTQESDVYAFGCLYYEIHYGRMPFSEYSDFQIFKCAVNGKFPLRLDDPQISDNSWAMIERCWERKPSKRPSMSEVKSYVMAICQSVPSQAVNVQNLSTAHPVLNYFSHGTPPTWMRGTVPLPPSSISIHPFLDGETPRSDYSFNLSSKYLCPMELIHGQLFRLRDETLLRIATHPPLYSLHIICDGIPDWYMKIEFDPDGPHEQAGLPAPPPTVGDVLYQIHRTLHEVITPTDWKNMDPGKKSEVTKAYFKRCQSEGLTEEERLRNDGPKKVDYLLDKIWFKGLYRTGEGDDVLKLMVES